MNNEYDDIEIKRVFQEEYNVEFDAVIRRTIEKIRCWQELAELEELTSVEEVEEVLGFFSFYMPRELAPLRIDTIKNQLWNIIEIVKKDDWNKWAEEAKRKKKIL